MTIITNRYKLDTVYRRRTQGSSSLGAEEVLELVIAVQSGLVGIDEKTANEVGLREHLSSPEIQKLVAGAACVRGSVDFTPFVVTGRRSVRVLSESALQARNELTEGYLSYVIAIALDFQGRGVELDDLIQLGNLGLMHAAEKYVPGESKFSTYSAFWIRYYISRGLEEVADISSAASLNAPVAENSDVELGDLLHGEDNVEVWLDEQNANIVSSLFSMLNDRHKRIAKMYYLDGLTYREIAPIIGITFQAVQQNIAKIADIFKQQLIQLDLHEHSGDVAA
jgi:RNA polymerase sigma factor (sigma-70 family)